MKPRAIPACNKIIALKFSSNKRFNKSYLINDIDSIITICILTLIIFNKYHLHINIPKEIWKPSIYIFTNKDGYLSISLSDAKNKKYHLKFFEEDGSPLFEIHQVKEPLLTLDKSNFVHAGWFRFELFEDDKLKEKNKFYLPKDF